MINSFREVEGLQYIEYWNAHAYSDPRRMVRIVQKLYHYCIEVIQNKYDLRR